MEMLTAHPAFKKVLCDARYDDFSVVPGGVVGHSEGLEAFPCPSLLIPKIFDSGAARIGNGSSFISTTHS